MNATTLSQLIKKWIGRKLGLYCMTCGERLTGDVEKWEQGYNLDRWCSNKRCREYEYRNRMINGERK